VYCQSAFASSFVSCGACYYPIRYHYDVNPCLRYGMIFRTSRRLHFKRRLYLVSNGEEVVSQALEASNREPYTHNRHHHLHTMDALPITNKTAGAPESTYNKALETGAGMTQVLHSPLSSLLLYLLLTPPELRPSKEDMRPPQRLPRLRARPPAPRRRSKPLLRAPKRRSAAVYSVRLS
jgi:hypothetical protein